MGNKRLSRGMRCEHSARLYFASLPSRTCHMKKTTGHCWARCCIAAAGRRPRRQTHKLTKVWESEATLKVPESRALRREAQGAVRLQHRRRTLGGRRQGLHRQGRPRWQGHRGGMGHGSRLPEGPRAVRRRQVAVRRGCRRHRRHRRRGRQDQEQDRHSRRHAAQRPRRTTRARCTCPTRRARRSTW